VVKVQPKFLAAGDTALTVEFGDAATRAMSALVLALDRRLAAAALPGVVETVPTMRSLSVHYDPLITSSAALQAAIAPLLDGAAEAEATGRRFTVPVCYGAAHAPDLAEVAARTSLSPDEVVRLFASVPYRVYSLGFVPGQAYLGDLPGPLHLPRRTSPRTVVAHGSVAIATTLATVYPLESPGGWHLIGRTPARFFDAVRDVPVLLAPADELRFQAITEGEWADLSAAAAENRWELKPDGEARP
jgi:inhibitor of KinA